MHGLLEAIRRKLRPLKSSKLTTSPSTDPILLIKDTIPHGSGVPLTTLLRNACAVFFHGWQSGYFLCFLGVGEREKMSWLSAEVDVIFPSAKICCRIPTISESRSLASMPPGHRYTGVDLQDYVLHRPK
ncbi:hypothetical protein CEXT_760671 [Caerostris extrusa]|uniref:Uncharacterized protein n=1 Tax=Caerostris extrusa TaxID=172846 RepID=A0AAV4SA22_CAEEX|nr:hypothetical protein CEXT_760671 [Caerostris extrusa]